MRVIITGVETLIPVYSIPDKRLYQLQLGADNKGHVVLGHNFRAGRGFFLIFLISQEFVAVDILHDKATFTSECYVETDLLQVIRFDSEQRMTVATRKTLILPNNASASKVKVTVTYLKEQSVQFLLHPLYSSDMIQYGLCLLVVPKQILSGRKILVV